MKHDAAIPVEEAVEELAPSRRFQPYTEYRDSGIDGVYAVPAHWADKPLKYVASVNASKLADTTNPDYELEYVDIGNVSLIDGVTSTESYRFENAPSRARRRVQPGDTIISTVRTYLKAVARIDDPPDNLVVSTGFAVLHAGEEFVPAYLYRLVQSDAFVERVVAHSVGVSYPAINPSDLVGLSIPIPPLDEQRSIAAFLDRETGRIDELIAKKQRLIELLAEKRTALISHAVTKGLNPDAPMKDSGIEWFGDVPEHWTITRLGWVSMEVSDINHEMPTSAADGVAFLSAKDLLDDGTLNFSDAIKRISEDDFERLSRKSRPRRGDIIYSRIGACLGKARLVEVDERFLVSYSCCVVRVKPSVADRRFFRHLLDAEMVLTEAKMRTQGIGVPDLGLSEICRFPVPLPPKSEQREIADYLDEKESTLRLLSRRVDDGLEQLREYRSALISEAVTGKIDVRGEA